MAEKQKMQNEELEQVGGGSSLEKGELESFIHRDGSYKCPFCGENYYLGDAEIHVGMCQKCWHNPDRLNFKKNKNN